MWGRTIITLYLVVFFCTCVPAAIGAYWFWANRKFNGTAPIMTRQAFLLFAVVYMFASELIVYLFGVVRPSAVYPTGYVIIILQSRLVLAVAVWALVKLMIRNYRK